MVAKEELTKMLELARELRASLDDTDAATQEDVLAAVRGRLRQQPDAPDAPTGYLLLVAEVVDLLDSPRLGRHQAHELERAFFRD